jgi:tRNA(Ile)-lysidine synthase
MINDFLNYTTKNGLIKKGAVSLIAVSGGVDSVVLCELFYGSGFPFAIAHCNFGLRGEESDEDQKFVESLAQKYKVEIHIAHLDASHFAAQKGVSIQMAARELRYSWFRELMKSYNYSNIVTAHHKNDVLETVLLNLTKGTGIAGLHGIKPKSNDIIRPLLFAEKEGIIRFAEQQGLKWREDSSNTSTKYQRNLLRLEVIPLLKKINSEIEKSLETTLEKINAVEDIFQKRVEAVRTAAVACEGTDVIINNNKILNTEQPVIILYEIIKASGFSYDQTKAIIGLIAGKDQPGKVFYSSNYVLNIDRGHLIISPLNQEELVLIELSRDATQTIIPGAQIKLQTSILQEIAIIRDPKIALLDVDKLKFPLKIRKWREGDWFRPLGMRGKKKVSDFMIDEKIPLNLKGRILIVTSGDDIVWVVGHRIDDRFRISDKTKNIFKIEIENIE